MKKLILKPASKHHFDVIDYSEQKKVGKIVVPRAEPSPDLLAEVRPMKSKGIKIYGGMEIHTGEEVVFYNECLDRALTLQFGENIVFQFSEDPLLSGSSNLICVEFLDKSRNSIIAHAPGYHESQLEFNDYMMRNQEMGVAKLQWTTNLFFSRWKHNSNLDDTFVPIRFREWSVEEGVRNHAYGRYAPIVKDGKHIVINTEQIFITECPNNHSINI